MYLYGQFNLRNSYNKIDLHYVFSAKTLLYLEIFMKLDTTKMIIPLFFYLQRFITSIDNEFSFAKYIPI